MPAVRIFRVFRLIVLIQIDLGALGEEFRGLGGSNFLDGSIFPRITFNRGVIALYHVSVVLRDILNMQLDDITAVGLFVIGSIDQIHVSILYID